MNESKRMEVRKETKNEQKTLKGWMLEHKKEIVITGIGIAALVGIGLGIKNKEAIKAFCNTLNKNNLKVALLGNSDIKKNDDQPSFCARSSSAAVIASSNEGCGRMASRN